MVYDEGAPEFVKAVEVGSASVSAVAEIATLPTCTLFIIKLSRFCTLLLSAKRARGRIMARNGAQMAPEKEPQRNGTNAP